MKEAQAFIFFGLSGAGKGTQAKLLKEHLENSGSENKVLHLSTGTLFREFMESGTYTAQKVKDILDEGGLLPEFLPIWIWTDFLNRHVKDNSEHLIFDGLARRFDEAPVLDGAISFYARTGVHVLVINVSKEEAYKRLKERGRYDDNDEDIETRFSWYEENVVPSINYFKGKEEYLVHDINGDVAIDEVQREILEKVNI